MRNIIILAFIGLLHPSCSSKIVSGDDSEPTEDDLVDEESHVEENDGGNSDGHGDGDASGSDTGSTDGGSADEGESEAGGTDEGGTGEDGTDDDFPLDGFGTITGDCNVLALPGDAGALISNTIDFGTETFDPTFLSHGGAELFEEGTLGGSSIHSEVMAFEVLHRCEIAFLLKSETEIEYIDPGGKKTDMLVEIDGQNVGVSVTRAFKWGEGVVYTEEDAYTLLSDKLTDVLSSAANAGETDAWAHAILHIITYDPSYAPSLEAAYGTLPASLTDQTIVVMTVTNGNDEFIY